MDQQTCFMHAVQNMQKGKKFAYALNICHQRLQEGFREPSPHTDEWR